MVTVAPLTRFPGNLKTRTAPERIPAFGDLLEKLRCLLGELKDWAKILLLGVAGGAWLAILCRFFELGIMSFVMLNCSLIQFLIILTSL